MNSQSPILALLNVLACLSLCGLLAGTSAFIAPNPARSVSTTTASTSASALPMAKGFGDKPKPKPKVSDGQQKRNAAASKYDEISAQGGQEYNIFVRQFGSDDGSWLPCGAICVPRGEQVSNAIFANETPLKSAIVRMYPKLVGFEGEMEFGSNLKIYPDDPVEVAANAGARSEGMSVGNWINNLLSPIDASSVQQPPPPTN